MGWAIQTIVKLFLRAVCELFGSLAADFITTFGINVGATFPTIANPNVSLNTVLSSYGSHESVFDAMFDMSAFKTIFGVMALTIATALFAKELFMAITSPMGISNRQTPQTSVFKYVLSVIGILLSYRLFIVIEYVMNQFYIKIGSTAITVMKDKSGSPDVLKDLMATGENKGIAAVLNITNYYTGTNLAVGIGEMILNLVIVYLLLINLLKLLLEILERYIVLGVLFYTSPLAFSTIASNDTNDIFKAWVRMSISQMILIATNSIFIAIFFGTLWKMTGILWNNPVDSTTTYGALNALGGSLMSTTNRLSWMVYMLLLLAWLLFAQRLDSYLNSLGLSTAQTGGGLGAAVMAGAAAVGGIGAKMGKKIWNSSIGKATRSPIRTNPYANTAKAIGNTALSKGGDAFARVSGKEKPASSQEAQSKLEGIQNLDKQAKQMRKEGNYAAANALQKASFGGKLTDNESAAIAGAMAGKTGDAKTDASLANGKNFMVGPGKNGTPTLSYEDANGGKGSLSLGGNSANKFAAGSYAGVALGASGDEKFMRGIAGDGAINAASAARATAIGGSAGWTDHGLGVGAVKTAGGGGEMILPQGTHIDSGSTVTDLGNGFVAVDVPAGKHFAGGSAMASLGFVSNNRMAQIPAITAAGSNLGYGVKDYFSGVKQATQMSMESRHQVADLMGINGRIAQLFLDPDNTVTANGDGTFNITSVATGNKYVLDTIENQPGYSSMKGNFGDMCLYATDMPNEGYSDAQLLEYAALTGADSANTKAAKQYGDMFHIGKSEQVDYVSANETIDYDGINQTGIGGSLVLDRGKDTELVLADMITTGQAMEAMIAGDPTVDDNMWVPLSDGRYAHLTWEGKERYNDTFQSVI